MDQYWGYKTTASNLTFGKLLTKYQFDLVIATSKYGKPYGETSRILAENWKSSKTILIVFGAPKQGVYEIVEQENLNLDNIADFVLNTIPSQRTETVRTEEALFVTLGIFNTMVAKS